MRCKFKRELLTLLPGHTHNEQYDSACRGQDSKQRRCAHSYQRWINKNTGHLFAQFLYRTFSTDIS